MQQCDKYVILAALRFIWPEDGILIFPGSGTYRYNDINEIEKNNYIRIEDKKISFEYIKKKKDKYYSWYVERVLRAVSRTLDEYQGVHNTYHYWETVLGTWMCYFILPMSVAYEHLKLLIEEHKGCKFVVCSKGDIENFEKKEIIGYIDKNSGGMVKLTAADKINYEAYIIYSSVLWEINEIRGGIDLHQDNIEYVYTERRSNLPKLTFRDKIKDIIKNIVLSKAKVSGFYDHDSTNRILLETKGNIRFEFPKCIYEYSKEEKYDEKLRDSLSISINNPDEFELIVSSLIMRHLPMEVLEEYKSITKFAKKRLPKPAKVINIMQKSDPLLMTMLGEWQKSGTKIAREACSLGDQMFVNWEFYEYGVDLYYLWSKDVSSKKYRSKPTYKRLCHNKWELNSETNKDILWCASGSGITGAGQVLGGYISTACYPLEYMPVFLLNLDDTIKKNVIYRSRDACGWGFEDFFCDIYPELRLDQQNPKGVIGAAWYNFAVRCSKSRIVIAETIMTGVIGEAFWVGTPCIIIDPDVNNWKCALREPNTDIFEKLEECGILYTDPAMASQFINENYDTIDVWWHSSEVQIVVQQFLDKYFYETEDIDSWLISEVNELAGID